MQAYQQATSVFIMIGNEKYFKTFTSQFLNVSDGSRILYTYSLDEICGMAKFCNIHLIVHDFAADISIADLKDKSLFGSNNNIKVVWDYCIYLILVLTGRIGWKWSYASGHFRQTTYFL